MKNKKIQIIIITAAILSLCAFLSFNFGSWSRNDSSVLINNQKFKVELAKSPEERYRGLGGREKLCSECGMVFLFSQKEAYPFVMRGMLFPLDIVWISGDEVVFVAENMPVGYPETIIPSARADKVLEISAGLASKYNIKKGDKIEFIN